MKTKNLNKLLKDSVLFGIGYVCGKHNLEVKKSERERIANEWVKKLPTIINRYEGDAK